MRNSTKQKARNRLQCATSKTNGNRNHLYVLENRVDGTFKVGCAADPAYRARVVSNGQSYIPRLILDLDGFGKYESEIHKLLKPWNYNPERRRKTELYKLSKFEMLQKMIDFCSRYES